MGERPNQTLQGGDEATPHEADDKLLRWCSYHKALHPLSAFSKAAKSADQLSWWCREGQREYRHKNPDKRTEYNRRTRERYRKTAVARSVQLALKRNSAKTYQSKYNPLGLRPEQRQA